MGLWQAPIKSRRRSSVGDGRHSESRSGPHGSTVAKRVSPPPPENPTQPVGRHRSELELITEQLLRSLGLRTVAQVLSVDAMATTGGDDPWLVGFPVHV